MFSTPLWRIRKVLAPIVSATSIVLAIAAPLYFDPIVILVLIPFTAFRVFNLARVTQARMHETYLRRVTTRTSLALVIFQLFSLGVILMPAEISAVKIINLLLILQAVVCTSIFLITLKNVRKLAFKMPSTYLSDKELPTVTVAIPARNETKDLEDVLRSVLASNYPKLEVLVLDDCSQAKTAEIIKSFANDGVRFIKGEPPEERWLAKNQAYHKLYQQSNGQLVLFCGVDVRFGPGAIRAMVNLLHSRKKKMLSVLPLRVAGEPNTTLFQPMRYWWELAIPRRLFNRPAVLSTCWMIDRTSLKKLGGFAAVSHAIMPEGFFARELVKTDSYSFVRSSEELDVRTLKSVPEQRATTLRVRYPQVRRRPEVVLLITVVELFIFVAPLFSVITLLLTGNSDMLILPTISLVAILVTHLLILQVTNPANVAMAVLTFPIAVVTEIVMGYASMFTYEFGTVEWKDRNVCIPVMHVYPRLPKLTEGSEQRS